MTLDEDQLRNAARFGIDPIKLDAAVTKAILPERESREILYQRVAKLLPNGWKRMVRMPDGRPISDSERYYIHTLARASTIITVSRELDGKRWLHFSASRADRAPTWEEFVELKEAFLGNSVQALVIIPPRSRYVNIHPNALHCFVCIEQGGDGIPDFTSGTGSL